MNKKLDMIGLIVSVIGGTLWCFLGGFLFRLLSEIVWIPLAIGVYFFGMGLLLVLVLLLSTSLNGDTAARSSDRRKALLLCLLMFALGVLFEFLYELTPTLKSVKPTSYVFLIDDSDSMRWNDPEDHRSEGLKNMLDSCEDDFPVAVYRFNHNCSMMMDMTAAKNARIPISFSSGGGTDIVNAVKTVVKDLENGVINGGATPRLVVFSDGESDDDGLRSVLNKAVNANISISTVSLGGAGESMLRRIAEDTKGTYVEIADIASLSGALNTAATTIAKVDRNLLFYRSPAGFEWMYTLMRLVFIAAFGIVTLFIKSLLARTNSSDSSNLLPAYLLAILVGTLAMEVGINKLRLSPRIMQLIMCVVFMILIIYREIESIYTGKGSSAKQFETNGQSGGTPRYFTTDKKQ